LSNDTKSVTWAQDGTGNPPAEADVNLYISVIS
jgi:hypothetical protein